MKRSPVSLEIMRRQCERQWVLTLVTPTHLKATVSPQRPLVDWMKCEVTESSVEWLRGFVTTELLKSPDNQILCYKTQTKIVFFLVNLKIVVFDQFFIVFKFTGKKKILCPDFPVSFQNSVKFLVKICSGENMNCSSLISFLCVHRV